MKLLINVANKFLAILKQLGLIFLYFVLVVMIQLPIINDLESTNIITSNASYIFAELLVATIFIFIFRKYIVPDFYDFKKNGKKYIKKYFKMWFLGLFIMVVSNLIISSYIGMAVNEELNHSVILKMPVYAFVAMIMIAPVVEELLTRVVLKKHFNIYIYSLLSGLFFGSLHLLSITSAIELLYIIPYGALGFCFAYMYGKSNNIWTNITFHSLHNLIALILFYIGV